MSTFISITAATRASLSFSCCIHARVARHGTITRSGMKISGELKIVAF
jgi:hypothetical protein